jgi:hypothetical protein
MPKQLDECVKKLKGKPGVKNPYAICQAQIAKKKKKKKKK